MLPCAFYASSLDFYAFEAIPSVWKLCRRLRKRQFAREICGFGDKHQTIQLSANSSSISRSSREAIPQLPISSLQNGLMGSSEAVMVCVDSTFMKAYSRRVGRVV